MYFVILQKIRNIIEKVIPFLSRYMEEIEYDTQKTEWSCLTSSYTNQQSYLPLLRLLIELKKATFQDVMMQRNCG